MKRAKPILAATLSLFLLLPSLASCAITPSLDEPFYTFTDDLGVTVSLAKKPQKVAVLFSSFADIWVSAGGTVSITVGESVERGFADAQAVLVDTGAGKTINTELLLSQRPDFVICSSDIEAQVQLSALLNEYGIPCAAMRVEGFKDYLRVLKIFTDITQRQDAYRTHGVQLKERINAMLASLEELPAERARVLFVRATSTAVKAKRSEDHFVAAMLEEIGAVNIADRATVLIDGLNEEVIIKEDPAHIFVSFMGNEEGAKANLEENKVWQSLSAVREGRCYYLPKDLFQYKPGARWDEAYRYLIQLLYEQNEP